jgi:uncharacterized protein (DUF362 family)/NAD-dependent dihydropyrimidine dehydrogenase PreA subunit
MKAKVSLVRCRDYSTDLVSGAVKKSVDLIGGVSAYIKPGSTVLVKPNLLAARGPETGIDTHPEVVRAVLRLLKSINCSIYLGDGPGVWGISQKVNEVYERSGMMKIAAEEEVKLVEFQRRRWYGKFPLTTWLQTCEYLVNIPKFKTHELTILTGAIKNLYGLVSSNYKSELHKRNINSVDFAGVVVDIFEKARPHLTIVDGVVAMEGDGPGSAGTLRDLGLVIAGSDCVAVDSVLAKIMGIEPTRVLTTLEAGRRKLGECSLSNIEISGEDISQFDRPFKLPVASKKRALAVPVLKLLSKFIYFYPVIDPKKCSLCGACAKACPQKIIHLKKTPDGSARMRINYSKCIYCFCCQESCLYKAIQIKKSVLAKLIGL